MPIILFLGKNVKEYTEKREGIIQGLLESGALLCELCLQPRGPHSGYERGIKETGQKIPIEIIRCKPCKKGCALLPDFLSPYKHYSGNEIESVIIDSANTPVSEIETEASESTVRRWISQVGEKIERACGILKYIWALAVKAISELSLTADTVYGELEQILEAAPKNIKYSGNKLGLANLWLGTNGSNAYI